MVVAGLWAIHSRCDCEIGEYGGKTLQCRLGSEFFNRTLLTELDPRMQFVPFIIAELLFPFAQCKHSSIQLGRQTVIRQSSQRYYRLYESLTRIGGSG